jgi:hypothetical protein
MLVDISNEEMNILINWFYSWNNIEQTSRNQNGVNSQFIRGMLGGYADDATNILALCPLARYEEIRFPILVAARLWS